MYGTDEHRAAVRRIGVVTRELSAQYDAVASLHNDLMQDELATTQEARFYLRSARVQVKAAILACDKAVAMLPTPASVQR